MKWLLGVLFIKEVWFGIIVLCFYFIILLWGNLLGGLKWCWQGVTSFLRCLLGKRIKYWLLEPPKMRWLHLSDIHFDPKDGREPEQLRDQFLEYIKAKNIQVDHIFLTGDYRNASKSDEQNIDKDVEATAAFIKKIANRAGVTDMSRVHLVPGNHDLEKHESKEAIEKIRPLYKKQESENESESEKEGEVSLGTGYSTRTGTFAKENKKLLVTQFTFFNMLQEELGASGIQSLLNSKKRLHAVRCKANEDFNLLYLNTAITFNDDKDYHKLVIGSSDLYGALQEIKKKNPKKPIIVLAHHSMEWFRKDECDTVKQFFDDFPDVCLYLCGHAHALGQQKINGVLELTTGCLKTDKGDETVFFVGELQKGKLSIETHKWERNNWNECHHFDHELATAIKKMGREPLKYWWWKIALFIFLCVVAFGGYGVYQTKYLQPKINNAKLDIAQLPGLNGSTGLNGSWWFEEIPWFIPPVREKLMQKLQGSWYDAYMQDKDGNKLDLFDTSVQKIHRSLWNIIGPDNYEFYNELSPGQKFLVELLHELSVHRKDPNVDNNNYWTVSFRILMVLFAKKINYEEKGGQCDAVDLHTLGNLCHRLAMLSEDHPASKKEYVSLALKYYGEALEQYKEEEKLKPLEILCKSDRLRAKYINVSLDESLTYDKVFEDFHELYYSSETHLSSLFKIEFLTTYGALLQAQSKFGSEKVQYDAARRVFDDDERLSKSKTSHPLYGYIAERDTWSHMEQWKIKDAQDLFENAKGYRKNSLDDTPSQTQPASIYILHNRHGLAMADRYLDVNMANASVKYEELIKEIDDINEEINNKGSDSNNSEHISKIWFDLLERAANTRERLADCTFYDGAASFAWNSLEKDTIKYQKKPEEYLKAAKLYGEAATKYEKMQFYRMVPVMRVKQAIMLMLCEGKLPKCPDPQTTGENSREQLQRMLKFPIQTVMDIGKLFTKSTRIMSTKILLVKKSMKSITVALIMKWEKIILNRLKPMPKDITWIRTTNAVMYC
ncbi:MAG: metallophosphoesterase [Planctomycetaceae bacterium]|nr:metallophosphoesterase [Planctomycetaceae bacterium]